MQPLEAFLVSCKRLYGFYMPSNDPIQSALFSCLAKSEMRAEPRSGERADRAGQQFRGVGE
jgi:hypothetical protein